MSEPPVPLFVESRTHPRIRALLDELEASLRAEGVDTSIISPLELTCLRKTPTRVVAIPPRSTWPRMARTLREVFMPLRAAMEVPLAVVGYRPPDYNAAVGGSPGSRHQRFEALDIRVASSHATAARQRALAMRAASLWLRRGEALKMGLGIYGQPVPGKVHVDTGWTRRTWNDTSVYLRELQDT